MSATLPGRRPLDETTEEVATAMYVATGLEGDSTRVVAPDHPAWRRVAYAHRHQDGWSIETHAAFWTALLPELPRTGRPRRGDLISRAAAALHEEGLDRVAIAEVLGITDPNTIRVHETHSRPSLERGERLLREARQGDQGSSLMRLTGSAWVPEEALPRVFVSSDDANGAGHFNHHIEHDWTPAGVDCAAAAENELRRRHHSTHG